MDVEVCGEKGQWKICTFSSEDRLDLRGRHRDSSISGAQELYVGKDGNGLRIKRSLFEQGLGCKWMNLEYRGKREAFARCDLQILSHVKHQRQASATKEMECIVIESVNNSQLNRQGRISRVIRIGAILT